MGCLSGQQVSGKPLFQPTVGIVRILGLESHLLTECITTGILRHETSMNSYFLFVETRSTRAAKNKETRQDAYDQKPQPCAKLF